MSNKGAVVVAGDASVSLGGRTIWSDATFTVEPGAFVAVLGPNGAGKSTLLRALLGLIPLDSGNLSVFGAPPQKGNPEVGYVPQRRTINLGACLLSREFVRFGVDGAQWGTGFPFGTTHRQRSERIDNALRAVDAFAYSNRPIAQLSGGEQQRLLLAQALVGNPQLLLLDEPLASLDVRNQSVIAQLVSDIARRHRIAVIMVTHDINPILPIVDEVIYVAKGKITSGKPSHVITTETLSALYESPVEVVRDSTGRVFVVGLENEVAHPHVHR